MNENVQFGDLINATVQVNNKSNTTRDYDISCEVTTTGTDADNFNNGDVREKGANDSIANFSCSGTYLNINFNDNRDTEKCKSILAAVNSFIKDVKLKVSQGQSLINL